jgi:hypothetical protein
MTRLGTISSCQWFHESDDHDNVRVSAGIRRRHWEPSEASSGSGHAVMVAGASGRFFRVTGPGPGRGVTVGLAPSRLRGGAGRGNQ